MSPTPWLLLLAGPNGAGKSTYATTLLANIEEVIGPDAIANKLLPTAPEKAALEAGRRAIHRVRQLLQERQSFAVETTLSSGRHDLRVVEQAKSEGWNVGLIYIGLGSPDLAIKRVHQRKLAGGHSVPPDDIRRRYERSLKNLAPVSRLADFVLVLDNSSLRRPKRVLEVHQGKVVFLQRRLPNWLRPILNQEGWKDSKDIQ